jgi:hypothetical protein
MESILEKSLAALVLAGVGALTAGELLGAPVILMLSSATIVLSTLFLSATFTSARISKKIREF